jgi:hypothetical protein
MNVIPPDYLYKYRALDKYSLASLTNNTIWLAKPESFNDPFDCAITLDRRRYKESILHALVVAMERAKPAGLRREHLQDVWPVDKEAFERFREGIYEAMQAMGICSFSASANQMLLWSHYADNHKGFVIEYDCSEGTELRELVRKVIYQDEMPSVAATDFSALNRERAFDALWLTKAKCWGYEDEWRVMTDKGNCSFTAPSKMVSIIFGARMPDSDREIITRALRHQPEITFKLASLKEGTFLLDIVDA